MPKVIYFVFGIILGMGIAFGASYGLINEMTQKLAEPEHCISVCVEQFEKYGC